MSVPSPRARPEPAPLAALAPAADDDQTGWLVTFSDLTLQLFAFVLVGLVLGRAAATRLEPPAARVGPLPTGAPPPVAEPGPQGGYVVPPMAGERGGPIPGEAPAATSLADAATRLEEVARAEGQQDAVTVTVHESELVLSLGDTIAFASGSADLLPDALPLLATVRALAAAMPEVGVHVVGHTDDVPIRTPEFPSNLELSLARAGRVARELAAGDPVLAARTVATGYGEHRPVVPNTGPEGRARNRRVEIWLSAPDRHG